MKIVDPDPTPEPKDKSEVRIVVVGTERDWVVYYANKIHSDRVLFFMPESYLWTQPLPQLYDVDEIHVVTQYPLAGIRSMMTYARWLDEAEQRGIMIVEVVA